MIHSAHFDIYALFIEYEIVQFHVIDLYFNFICLLFYITCELNKNKTRQRYNCFAVMVQDCQTHVGCAAVQFYDASEAYQKISWVCNYACGNVVGAPVYEIGIAGSGCTLGKNTDFPNLCRIDEPIKAIPHKPIKKNNGASGATNLSAKKKKVSRGKKVKRSVKNTRNKNQRKSSQRINNRIRRSANSRNRYQSKARNSYY